MNELSLEEENRQLKERVKALEQQIRLLNLLHFGPKSERVSREDAAQGRLFNEAEECPAESEPSEKERVSASESSRGKRSKNQGRRPIDPSLPREKVEYDLSEAEKTCACGAALKRIGADESERLQIVPAKITVLHEFRYKYSCPCCEGTTADESGVKTAEGKRHLLPGSIATSGLLAWSLTEKFEYALPFYRQEKRFSQIGLTLSRATLCNWAMLAACRCQPLLKRLVWWIQDGELINADETRVQVLREAGKSAQSQSWMWVFRGETRAGPAVVFQYRPSRGHETAKEFLTPFCGWLQTDDYGAYHTALSALNAKRAPEERIRHMLCWAHVRRGFTKALELSGGDDVKRVLGLIAELFGLETLRENRSESGFLKLRKNRAAPILDQLYSLLTDLSPRLPPSLQMGKAVAYTLDNWGELSGYLEHPLLTPSNNAAENAIRPFVVGRKNWLFSTSAKGAEASAAIYSLLESAKMNGLSPYEYLYYIFEHIPSAVTTADWDALLPFHLTPEMIKIVE